MSHSFFLLTLLHSIIFISCTQVNSFEQEQKNMRKDKNTAHSIPIEIHVGSSTFDAILYDNPTSRSLIELMPIEAELKDYGGIEKIFYPALPLSGENKPEGAKASVGDIMYYAPWGDVAIFYKSFQYSRGLIPMGHINKIEEFVRADSTSDSIKITTKK